MNACMLVQKRKVLNQVLINKTPLRETLLNIPV
jgi:hypothetical protein